MDSDDDIPQSFKDGMKDAAEGRLVDMETALTKPYPVIPPPRPTVYCPYCGKSETVLSWTRCFETGIMETRELLGHACLVQRGGCGRHFDTNHEQNAAKHLRLNRR